MRRYIFTLLLSIVFYAIQAQYAHENIALFSHWKDDTLTSFQGTNNVRYNSIYGWYDPVKKREYAILGGHSGTYFIEVTNPYVPVVRDFVPGRRDSCVWREYRTFDKYAYMVSDDGGNNSFQIADLSYLPDSVHVVHDDNTVITQAHTIFVEENRLYLASPKGKWGYGSMAVFSLDNPELPELKRILDADFPGLDAAHDMFVRHDTVYVSDGFKGLFIFRQHQDFSFTPIGSLTSYPAQGYNHASSLTPDGKTLIFCDEIPSKLPVKALDVRDFSNLSILDTFRCVPGGTPHNPYVLNNDRVIVSYYADGVQVFDISRPDSIFRTGYFDTDTLDENGIYLNAYNGCWGAYIYLPSGIMLASDRQNGLYVLDPHQAYIGEKKKLTENMISLFPNPSNNNCFIDFQSTETKEYWLEIYDVRGRLLIRQLLDVQNGNNRFPISMTSYAKGIYTFHIYNEKNSFVQKILKQ